MHTGRITIDDKGQVHRALLLATYTRGLAHPLKPASSATRP